MKESINIWGIKEFEGDGISCPIIPANLRWYKKVALTFFRFGVCPLCVTMSLAYSIGKFFRKLFGKTQDQNKYQIVLSGITKGNRQQIRLRRAWKANDEADVVRNRSIQV